MVIDEYYDKAIEALRAEQKAFHGVMEAGRTMDAKLFSDSIDLANKAISRRIKALKDLVTVRDKNVEQVQHELRKHYGIEK